MVNSIPVISAGETCKTMLKNKKYLSRGTQRTQETQKNQICPIEINILNSPRSLREDTIFVVCLMSVQ